MNTIICIYNHNLHLEITRNKNVSIFVNKEKNRYVSVYISEKENIFKQVQNIFPSSIKYEILSNTIRILLRIFIFSFMKIKYTNEHFIKRLKLLKVYSQ